MRTVEVAEFLEGPIDFLIVGGGTAGAVLAARLSEDPTINVGVIEAGLSRLDDPKVDLPTGPGLMLKNPEYDWDYQSVPQNGTGNKIYHIPRGKMVGGSSGINFMAYGRPCAEEIDDWSKILGIEGWSWSDLLTFFKKSECLQVDKKIELDQDFKDFPLDRNTHGFGGAIYTSMGSWQVPFEKPLAAAFEEVSELPTPHDPYGGSHLGFYRSVFTTNRIGAPVRSYAANGYLAPAAVRPNLKILTGALVTRITFESRQSEVPVANGVEFLYEESSYVVGSRREVIISAGSIKSPQLLELSGIGDPKILQQAQVSCLIANENVGKNLQEHIMSAVVYELASDIMSLDLILRDPALLKAHQKLYTELHTGAFSGCISLMGYIPYSSQVTKAELDSTVNKILSDSQSDDEIGHAQNDEFQAKQRQAIVSHMRSGKSADILLVGTPAHFDIARGHSNCSKLTSGAPSGHNACYTITVSNMFPVSRGSVHIKSSNPLESPMIDPSFLSHPADVEILAAGIDFADRVFQSDHVKDKILQRIDPPPNVNLRNREEAQKFVRERIVSYHHALGTCAMGQVVDSRLRVKGVDRLRVVDASILPMQVSAPIMATVYATAEKAAAMIKEDYESSRAR